MLFGGTVVTVWRLSAAADVPPPARPMILPDTPATALVVADVTVACGTVQACIAVSVNFFTARKAPAAG